MRWHLRERAVAFAVIASLGLGGCRARSAAPSPALVDTRSESAAAERLRSLGSVDQQQGAQPTGATPATPEVTAGLEAMAAARKLIRTGQATVEVPSYRKAAQELTRLAESLGGYAADSQSRRDDGGHERGTLTLRVPAGRFDELLAGTAALGIVRSQNVSAQDVTKAYADLETRLRVKRDTAERLRAILRTQTAKLSDVLEAERELARVTGEIEQTEGERRFYDQQIALSSLTVELVEPQALMKADALAPLREALRDAMSVLASSVAVMVYFAAGAAPWIFVLWLLWRLVRSRLKRRRATPPPVA